MLTQRPFRERNPTGGFTRLVASADVHRISLAPLRPQETRELVAGLRVLDEPLARDVAERSGGSPPFATQRVGGWVRTGELS